MICVIGLVLISLSFIWLFLKYGVMAIFCLCRKEWKASGYLLLITLINGIIVAGIVIGANYYFRVGDGVQSEGVIEHYLLHGGRFHQ